MKLEASRSREARRERCDYIAAVLDGLRFTRWIALLSAAPSCRVEASCHVVKQLSLLVALRLLVVLMFAGVALSCREALLRENMRRLDPSCRRSLLTTWIDPDGAAMQTVRW